MKKPSLTERTSPPTDPTSYKTLIASKDYEGALDAILRLIEETSPHSLNLFEMASLFLAHGAVEQATELYMRSIQYEREPASYLVLGEILLSKLDTALAIPLFLKAAPTHPIAYYFLLKCAFLDCSIEKIILYFKSCKQHRTEINEQLAYRGEKKINIPKIATVILEFSEQYKQVTVANDDQVLH